MATFFPIKSYSVTVLAHQAANNGSTIVGSPVDCLTKRAATIFLYHGYVEAAADTNPGSFLVQVRPEAGDGTVNESWITVFEGVAKGTSPDNQALTNSPAANATSLEVTSTSNFAIGDLLYITDSTGGGIVDGEWARLKKLSTGPTAIQLIDGLTNAKTATSDKVFNDASEFVVSLDLNAIESFRVVWTHEGSGADGHIKALASTYDSDTST